MSAAARPRVPREVVSFVRRSTRMNPSQQRNWDAWHDRWVVPLAHRTTSTSVAPGQSFDPVTLWGRRAPLWVEIGTGNGEACAAIAAGHPEANYLAFEVFKPSVASTLGLLARAGVGNVRIVEADGADALRHWLPPASIDRLLTFFPDPWHKARHHKRRLVNPTTAALVADRLAPGGCWHLATDWPDYAETMREVLDACPGLTDTHPGLPSAPRYPERPITRFEQRGLDAGRPIVDLTYRRPGPEQP